MLNSFHIIVCVRNYNYKSKYVYEVLEGLQKNWFSSDQWQAVQ